MLSFPEPRIRCPFCDARYLEQQVVDGFEGDEVMGTVRCPKCHWEGTVVYTVEVQLLDKFTHKPVPDTPKGRSNWQDKAGRHIVGTSIGKFPMQ